MSMCKEELLQFIVSDDKSIHENERMFIADLEKSLAYLLPKIEHKIEEKLVVNRGKKLGWYRERETVQNHAIELMAEMYTDRTLRKGETYYCSEIKFWDEDIGFSIPYSDAKEYTLLKEMSRIEMDYSLPPVLHKVRAFYNAETKSIAMVIKKSDKLDPRTLEEVLQEFFREAFFYSETIVKKEVKIVSQKWIEEKRKINVNMQKTIDLFKFLNHKYRATIISRYAENLERYLGRLEAVSTEEGGDILVENFPILVNKIKDDIVSASKDYNKGLEKQKNVFINMVDKENEDINSSLLWHLNRLEKRL